jgi:hypothetical protein
MTKRAEGGERRGGRLKPDRKSDRRREEGMHLVLGVLYLAKK